jgi:hypothetical protein
MWIKYVMMILSLIDVVEKVYKDLTGKGAIKKDTVMAAARTIALDITKESTGGQAETWELLNPLISDFVDGAVKITNMIKPGTVTDEDFERSKAGILP